MRGGANSHLLALPEGFCTNKVTASVNPLAEVAAIAPDRLFRAAPVSKAS